MDGRKMVLLNEIYLLFVIVAQSMACLSVCPGRRTSRLAKEMTQGDLQYVEDAFIAVSMRSALVGCEYRIPMANQLHLVDRSIYWQSTF